MARRPGFPLSSSSPSVRENVGEDGGKSGRSSILPLTENEKARAMEI